MSFSGLLPETINGRAAMLGMLAAFGAEVATHQPVFQQVSSCSRPSTLQALHLLTTMAMVPDSSVACAAALEFICGALFPRLQAHD